MDFKCYIYCEHECVGRLEIVGNKLVKNDVYNSNVFRHPCPNSHDYYHVMNTLRDRVIPPCRFDEEMQEAFGFKEYNVLRMLKNTHGVIVDDKIWFKFDDDRPDLTWEDVGVRL